MTEATKKIIRSFTGTVVSDKMDKTIVVRVDQVRWHPKYGKQFKRSVRYKVHDEKNEAKVGDVVTFIASRPYSREKRWRLVSTQANGTKE